jgi:hypothetical protein
MNPIGFDGPPRAHGARGCAAWRSQRPGDDEILAKLAKASTLRIRRAHGSRAPPAQDCHTFVLGTPGETLDHVRRTLDFIGDLDPFAAIMLPWVDDAESFDPDYRRERAELREGILELLRERATARWIVPPLSLRFDERLFDALRARGFRGPLWQHIDQRTRARRAAMHA